MSYFVTAIMAGISCSSDYRSAVPFETRSANFFPAVSGTLSFDKFWTGTRKELRIIRKYAGVNSDRSDISSLSGFSGLELSTASTQ